MHGEGKVQIKAPQSIEELAGKNNIKFGRTIDILKGVDTPTNEERTAINNVPDIETKIRKVYKELATL